MMMSVTFFILSTCMHINDTSYNVSNKCYQELTACYNRATISYPALPPKMLVEACLTSDMKLGMAKKGSNGE